MAERLEWVEIIEPKTGEPMFANLKTGQCLWEPPPTAKVKKAESDQWWELYDMSNRRYYYFNAATQKTVWHKPKDCDIIPLAKLQVMRAKQHAKMEKKKAQSSEKKHEEGTSLPRDPSRQGSLRNDERKSSLRRHGSGSRKDNLRREDSGSRHDSTRKSSLRREESGSRRHDSKGDDVQREESLRRRRRNNDGVERRDSESRRLEREEVSTSQSYPERESTTTDSPRNQPEVAMPDPPSKLTPAELRNRPRSNSFGEFDKDNSYPVNIARSNSDTAETSIRKRQREQERPDIPSLYDNISILPQLPNSDSIPSPNKLVNGDCDPSDNQTQPLSSNGTVMNYDASRNGAMSPGTDSGTSYSPPDSSPSGSLINGTLSRELSPSPSSGPDSEEPLSPSGVIQINPLDLEVKENLLSPSGTFVNERLSVYDNLLMVEPLVPESDVTMQQQTVVESGEVFVDETEACNTNERGDDTSRLSNRLTGGGMSPTVAALVEACDPSQLPPKKTPPPRPAPPSAEALYPTLTRNRKKSDDVVLCISHIERTHSAQEDALQDRPNSMVESPDSSSPNKAITLERSNTEPSTLRKKNTDLIKCGNYLSKHRKGFFRKKVSIATMLSWSKTPIKKPMVMTRDKNVKKEAVDMFKLVLSYMGDKPSRKNADNIALEIMTKGWSTPSLRDELFIQLCKQTTVNDKPDSLKKGWEIMSIALCLFPPSFKFHSYVEGYIYRHLEPEINTKGVPVSDYANFCYKKLERISQTGAKKGLKKPSVEEIQQARITIFNPSMFGSCLEDVMQMQENNFPDRKLPWILTTLTTAVLDSKGAETEGIFRVPGDIDEVNSLKIRIGKWEEPGTYDDPAVPASLLKLWFRELPEPLIPETDYEKCIKNFDDPTVAQALVFTLPEINRLVLCYLIRFLQIFSIPQTSSITKMDHSNLAMVWAPNCLRCPSDDPRTIFDNARKEMTFMRNLIVNLDTTFIDEML